MTFVVAALMILVSAGAIALPFLRPTEAADAIPDLAEELLEREKNAALLAIREADFDRAMGKLSDDDHAALRSIYEERALDAMNAIGESHVETEDPQPTAGENKPGPAAFCVRCGAAFSESDKFCSGCGSGRPRLVESS